MIARRRSGLRGVELLRVRPDAGQRGLQVVADAPEEVVLGGVELEELVVLELHRGEQLGVADRGGHLAGEELQQVLVGRLPAARRGQPPDQHAKVLTTRAQDRAQRPRDAGHDVLLRDRRRVIHHDGRIDQRERRRRVVGGPLDEGFDIVARRDLVDRGKDPPELPVAAQEVRRESVVAVGEACELVVAGDLDRGREVAGRDPVDRRRDRPQRGKQSADERERGRGSPARTIVTMANSRSGPAGASVTGPGNERSRTASTRASRIIGRTAAATRARVSRARIPRPFIESMGPSAGSRRFGRPPLARWRSTAAGTRCRGRSGRAAACWGRPRPSGGVGAS